MEKYNFSFLKPFLIVPELQFWDAQPPTDLGKKLREVFYKLKDSPESITELEIRAIVDEKDSGIGRPPENYWNHIVNTGIIYEQVTRKLLSIDSTLDLPNPQVARVRGLVHDLSKTFEKYGDEGSKQFRQETAETTWFALAKELGLKDIEDHVAMHHAYFEILDLVAKGEVSSELYFGWRQALNNAEHPMNLTGIKKHFQTYLNAQENLSLMALTVVDCLTPSKLLNPEKSFEGLESKETFESFLKERNQDIENRHYYNRIKTQNPATVIGRALIEGGGKERIERYASLLGDLLFSPEASQKYRETHPKLFH